MPTNQLARAGNAEAGGLAADVTGIAEAPPARDSDEPPADSPLGSAGSTPEKLAGSQASSRAETKAWRGVRLISAALSAMPHSATFLASMASFLLRIMEGEVSSVLTLGRVSIEHVSPQA